MNFQVPQFIEIEDKIFGPLTFKQFIYIAGSGGLAFIVYAFLPLFLAIVPMIAIISLGFALAFYQVNNRPFILIVESFLKYLAGHKLYIWKKSTPSQNKKVNQENIPDGPTIPKLSSSRLKDLSWSLDVKENIK